MIKARLLGRRKTGFLSVSPKSGSPLQGITNQKVNFRTFVQDRILFCLFWEVEQFCSTGMHGASQFCTEVSTESNWGVRCTSPPCFAPQWRSRATFANWLLFSCCCCSYCTLLSGATLGSAEGGSPTNTNTKIWVGEPEYQLSCFWNWCSLSMRWSWSLLYFWYLDKYFYLSS